MTEGFAKSTNAARRRLGRRACLPTALVALPLLGCVQLPRAAQDQLSQAETAYRQRNYAAAQSKLDDILRDYPGHKQSAEAYYLRSLCRIAHSNKLGASADIKKCLELSTNADLTVRANATAGELDFEAGNYSEAARHFEQAFSRAGQKSIAQQDLLHYRYGVCLQRLGQWKAARAEFAMAQRGSSDGSVAAQARTMSEWGHDFFVIQCGAFRDAVAATKRVRELQGVGLVAKVESRVRSGETIRMVYVGSYTTHEQARQALASLKQKAPGAVIFPQ